jgi:hypothetical protein
MEFNGVPVCYTDEQEGWDEFYRFIESRLPIDTLEFIYADASLGPYNLRKVNIVFHSDKDRSIWDSCTENPFLYRYPYAHLYLLCIEDWETFKSISLPQILSWIEQHRNDEWLVVFMPHGRLEGEVVYVRKDEDVELAFTNTFCL